ncbi:hypothetical protein [Desulfoferrobacter suflitae]|uniref:hypothetical protein n=1 Tax=Desulfoferrobacter suflitae TaxID=2865782 RepID=UPI00216484B7|nr:hypothetical protein [Desulfoferrobacter suflitae]MCK8604236.1 hypothetical protein [Desulfoferrobacter suflitae]
MGKKTFEPVLVVSGNLKECEQVCNVLNDSGYEAVTVNAVEHIEESLLTNGARVVFLDLDSFSVNNHFIKMFRKRNPEVCIFVISSRLLHPELQESISTDISACLRKPVDSEEMLYLLRSIIKKDHGARDSPKI